MNHIDHAAKMAAQDPAFPEYDERGWPTALVGLVLNVRDDATRLLEIARSLRSTNAIRAEQVVAVANSLQNGAMPAERYMTETAGPGLHALLSVAEQRYILRHPDALAILMDYHDQQQDQADSMGADCHGDERRSEELKALGAAVIREDAAIWPDATISRFGVKP
jgi:hypothetical protein